MNTFKKTLLLLALTNLQETGSTYSEFQTKKGDDFFYYSSAAEELGEYDMLVLCDRPNILCICYELTDQGLEAARQLDMEK